MEIRALVVDDSKIMRRLVMRSLRQTKLAQFIFTEAADGVEGLAKLQAGKTDMIFVDWNMPNMDGIDFVKTLRADRKRHIPVVMVTTESTLGKVEEALDQAGVDCFVVKPFTTEVLIKKLEPLIDTMAGPKRSGGFFNKLAAKMT